jgi:hypothetical protein
MARAQQIAKRDQFVPQTGDRVMAVVEMNLRFAVLSRA